MMKKIVVLLVVVAIAVGGWKFWQARQRAARESARQTRTVTVKRGPIETTVDATGEVSPLNRVEVKPPISGRIEKLIANEGDTVKAGTILAWMSSSDRAAILDAARAQGPGEVKYWEDAYKPTPIIAPLSGVIILRNVVVGQTVDNSTVLYAMSDRLMVVAQVDEADIGRIKIGMPARMTLDAYPNDPLTGKVMQILFEGKNVSNVITYDVKVQPDKVPPFFRSQMTANVSFIVQHRDDALLLPSAAVKEGADGSKFVLIPAADGGTENRAVTTGVDNGQSVEILSGIDEGQNVLIVSRRYVPQKGEQNSPLTMGRRPSNNKSGGGGGRQGH